MVPCQPLNSPSSIFVDQSEIEGNGGDRSPGPRRPPAMQPLQDGPDSEGDELPGLDLQPTVLAASLQPAIELL